MGDRPSAHAQLAALEAGQFGIGPEPGANHRFARFAELLRRLPLEHALRSAEVSNVADTLKTMRFALSVRFVGSFWQRHGALIRRSVQGLAAAPISPDPERLLDVIRTYFDPSDEALAHADTAPILASLCRSLSQLSSGRLPEHRRALDDWLMALATPLMAAGWLKAIDWEHTMDREAEREPAEHAWSNYRQLLTAVGDYYASPAVHMRSGIEGYVVLLVSMIGAALADVEDEQELRNLISRRCLSALGGLSRTHMLSVAALDEHCRARPDKLWLMKTNSPVALDAEALGSIRAVMHVLASRSNTQGRFRVGCPFTGLDSALGELHRQGFTPLAERWLYRYSHALMGAARR